MVQVSKSELSKIKERFPNVQPVKTMKCKSSRGKIYIAEYQDVMKELEKIRTNCIAQQISYV